MTTNPDFGHQGSLPGRVWLVISLTNFLVAAMIGCLLRFAFVEEIPGFHFRNFLYAHSHLAMLGWVFQGLLAALMPVVQPGGLNRTYRILFLLSQGMVTGMTLTFPVLGYASWAIVFAAGHMVVSYGFVIRVWQDLRIHRANHRVGGQFVRTALIWLVLASVSMLAMGPIMANGLRDHLIFYLAVQWFLHFQFNGWFLFMALGLWFIQLENDGHPPPEKESSRFHLWMVIATPLTFALALAWSNPDVMIFAVNSIGVVFQTIALVYFLRLIRSPGFRMGKWGSWSGRLFVVAAVSFFMKGAIQAMVVIPAVAELAYTVRNFVIGFIHLITLGALSMFILAVGIRQGQIRISAVVAIGIVFLMFGFSGSEFLLFFQGGLLWLALGFLPGYDLWLFGISVAIPLGLVLILSAQWRGKP